MCGEWLEEFMCRGVEGLVHVGYVRRVLEGLICRGVEGLVQVAYRRRVLEGLTCRGSRSWSSSGRLV